MEHKHKEITNDEIHSELKKLHLSVQFLSEAVKKLHEEVVHIHNAHHKKSWWQFWR